MAKKLTRKEEVKLCSDFAAEIEVVGRRSHRIHKMQLKSLRARIQREVPTNYTRAELLASQIIATLEFIGIDFTGYKISAQLEVTKHVQAIMREKKE